MDLASKILRTQMQMDKIYKHKSHKLNLRVQVLWLHPQL